MGGQQCWRLPMMINDMAPSLSCHFLYFLEQIGSPVCQKDVTATCKKKYYASQRGFGSHINKEKHFLVPVEYPSYFPLDIDSMDDRLEGKELKPGVTLLCVPI